MLIYIKQPADIPNECAFTGARDEPFFNSLSNLDKMTEFELKFEIPRSSLKRLSVTLQDGKVTRQRLQASYFDTPDGALSQHGIVVRLRKEGRRWYQTAKAPTADPLARLEHNAALPPQPAGSVPVLDLARHQGTPVGHAVEKALGVTAPGSYPVLDLMYGVDVQRVTLLVVHGVSTVEIALDQGRVFTNGQSQTICELEFELKEGSPLDAVALARQWRAEHGLWISTIAKSMKGQRLRSAVPFGEATSAASPQFARHACGQEMITKVVEACLSQILPNMSELASGSKHPDHIHQLRVGVRRLRTALRELSDLTDAIDPAWESHLVQAFSELGRHRDYSHMELVVQPQLLAAGGPTMRFGDATHHLTDPGDIVRSADFQNTLLGLLSLLHRAPPQTPDKPDALKNAISQRLEMLHTRALHDGKRFLALDEEHQHRVRKHLKRLRYLIEFAAPLFSARKLNRMVAKLKPLQDALGQHNDELTALHAWRELANNDPNAWFGVGWLSARKQPNAKRCFKEIKAFARIKPFWRE